MRWFKHFSDSLDDPFIQDLMDKFSHQGYVAFFGLIEIIAKENGSKLTGNLSISPSYLKRKTRISTAKLDKIFSFCHDKKRFVFNKSSTKVEQKFNKSSTKVEQKFNKSSTKVQQKFNKSSTKVQLFSNFSEKKWNFSFPKILALRDNYTAHGAEAKGLTKAIRERIRSRDKDTCRYCGKHCKNSDLVIDHIVPYDKTGDSTDNNLVVACRSCNSVKGDRTPEEAGFHSFEHPSNKLSNQKEAEEEAEEEEESNNKRYSRERDKNSTESRVTAAVLVHLNERIGKQYRPSSAKTKRLVAARIAEGYEVDDFKRVIDTKCGEWLHDRKMAKFLRPETLFGSKFESYLNQPMPTKASSVGGIAGDSGKYAGIERSCR